MFKFYLHENIGNAIINLFVLKNMDLIIEHNEK